MDDVSPPVNPARTKAQSASASARAEYPYTATALVVAAGLPVRFKIPFALFGSFTLLDVVLVGAALRLFFGTLSQRGRLKVGHLQVTALLAIPVLVCVVSLIWTSDLRATVRAVAMFAEAMVAYVVAVNTLAGLRTQQLFARAGGLVVLLLLGSLLSILQIPGFGPETPPNVAPGGPEHIAYLTTYYARLSNPFYGLSNDYASVLALYVLPLFAWGVVSRKTGYSLLAGTAFAGVALTLSRGVVIATVAGGILFLAAERRRVTRWIPGIVLGGGLVATMGYVYYRLNEAVQTHLLDRLTATTIQVREAILTRTLQQIAESPLLGYGGGVVSDPLLADGVHNTYLQQVLYYGIPLGVVCSAALWLLATRLLLWPLRRRAARVMAAAIGVSVLIQLGVFLVETSFEATLPKTALYFFVAFGVIVVMQMNREELALVSSAPDTLAPR